MGKRKTTEQFISEAIKVHGDKYDYSKVEYKGCDTNVLIICPKHGGFNQRPFLHLKGSGCVHCNTSVIRRTSLYGIATVDVVDATSPENRKAYSTWIEMLSRCYNPAMLNRFPTYNDVTV